ncbi:succinoglycan biosynthesis transport protein ExoP [Rhizobium sp. BK251]|nr:succinoglycan biosynthesis transport protein ExoP [Rhizobium sp. BK251]
MFACIAVGILIGLIYSRVAIPLYSAQATLFLDVSKGPLINRYAGQSETPEETDGGLLSELEVMRSKVIGGAVVDKLNLTQNEEFMSSRDSLLDIAIGWLSGTGSQPETDPARLRQNAIAKLQDGATITRVAQSYIFDLRFASTSPELSAKIANALGEAYVADRVNSTYESMSLAGNWLRERVEDLREKTRQADLAVERYRSANGLVRTGTELLSDQRLQELSTALVDAGTETAKARAKYESLKAVIDSGRADIVVNDVLQDSISKQLRTKYLDASKREADISKKYGADHVQAVRLRQEMQDYARLMFEELNRVANGYRSSLDMAQSHENELAATLAKATGNSENDDRNNVELRELERTENTYRNMYQIFLDRYQESIQQESFPVTNARIISFAEAPERPSFPRLQLVLFMAVIFSGTLAMVLAAYLETRRRYFRNEKQVADELGLDFLGTAPPVSAKGGSLGTYAADNPFSPVSETLRSAKIAVDLFLGAKSPKVIGIVSAFAGEGASWMASNLASLLASQGDRTLLIDCDLRNKSATRMLMAHARAGIVEVLLGQARLADVETLHPTARFRFIPAALKRQLPNSSQLLASPMFKQLLSQARTGVDYIILDLPPISAVVDARAVANEVDLFILVVDQPRTERASVRDALAQSQVVAEKCVGVILNKVDARKYESRERSDETLQGRDMPIAAE